MATLPENKQFKIELKADRSNPQNNVYWAGLALLHRSSLSDEEERFWPEPRDLHKAFLKTLGYTTRQYSFDPHDETRLVWRDEADSTAFDEMDADRFTSYFDKVKALVMVKWSVDPWHEWVSSKKAADDWRRNYREGDRDE